MKKFFLFMMVFLAISLIAFPAIAEISASKGTDPTLSASAGHEAITLAEATAVKAPSVKLRGTILYNVIYTALIVSTIDWAILSVIALILYVILKAIVTKAKERPKEEGVLPWWKRMFEWIRWGLRQMLPLTYRSHYEQDGKKHFTVWRMWLGKCFDQEDVIEAS